ncbi:MAG TPA: DUF3047 domain-containing protein [Saliniramus sp.]|nr:DUF3047 domain-containing protein [Saliniramus sp.]
MIRKALFAGTAIAFASLALPHSVRAEPVSVPFGPSLEQAGWEALTFRWISETQYVATDVDTLGVVAEGSSSVISKRLPEQAFDATRASWRWRVDESAPATDLSQKGGDDRALAIYFAFAPESDRASAADGGANLRNLLLTGRGQLLVYVWGGEGARGEMLQNPYTRGRGVYIIQRPASTGTGSWLSEEVDLRADFARAFGGQPGVLVGVAVASDSDDTESRNVAAIADLMVR